MSRLNSRVAILVFQEIAARVGVNFVLFFSIGFMFRFRDSITELLLFSLWTSVFLGVTIYVWDKKFPPPDPAKVGYVRFSLFGRVKKDK
jgi:hypothetical protein